MTVTNRMRGVLYRLDASIRVEGSHSRAIADLVEQEWRSTHPEEPIIRRHIGVDPMPARAWATAVFASGTPEESRSDEQNAALTLAATLTDELVSADALLFAVPLYNFGVSQHFKAWVDMVIADHRMAAGAEPIMAGKPAVLVTVRGGSYRPGTPREGWDHATGWMQRVLADVWQLDLKTVEAEFTLVGVNPALDQFRDLARRQRAEAEEQAIAPGASSAPRSRALRPFEPPRLSDLPDWIEQQYERPSGRHVLAKSRVDPLVPGRLRDRPAGDLRGCLSPADAAQHANCRRRQPRPGQAGHGRAGWHET